MTFTDNTKHRQECGGLTLIELFPLFIAVIVTLVSAAILTKFFGGDSNATWIISAALGAGSWILYGVMIMRWRRKL
jgi:ABC-type transport system involved in multi-copper enzyme maturation permease subunit